MRVLVMGGTEFISLHLLQALQQRGHEVTVFNRGRHPDRLPAGVAAIAGDRKDHAALRERLGGAALRRRLRRHLRADAAARTWPRCVDALPASPHVLFVSTCRVYDHALPIPYSEETAAQLLLGRLRAAQDRRRGRAPRRATGTRGLPVTIVRPTHVMGPLNTRNNETFFMDRISRGRPVLVPGARRLAAAVRPRRGPGRGDGHAAGRCAGLRAGLQRDGRGRGEPGGLRRADRRGDRPAGSRCGTSTPPCSRASTSRARLRPEPRLRLPRGPHHHEAAQRAGPAPALHAPRRARARPGSGTAPTASAERPVDFSFEDRLLAKIGA